MIAVAALAVTLVYGTLVRNNLNQRSLESRFAAASVAKSDELSRYVESLFADTLQLASSPMTVDAARQFSAAYAELPEFESLSEDQRDALLSTYRDDYVPALSVARDRPVTIGDVWPATSSARYLQAVYLGMAVEDGVAPDAIDDARDGTTWSEVHADVHPALRASALAYGFEDLMIVDTSNLSIIYSVGKFKDFGTNLDIGPVGGTGLSALVQQVLRDPTPGKVSFVDFARYDPDIAAPVTFVGAPVYDGTEFIAVLVAKITSEKLSEITTQNGDWASMRIGTTGEVFIVGPDGRLRTDSRLFVEDSEAYFAAATSAGTLSQSDIPGIESASTSAWFQRMDASTLRDVVASPGTMIDSRSYLGDDVFTVLDPIGDGTLGWSLVVQVQRAEALAISASVERLESVSVAIFVLILTFVAAGWAASFVRPVVVLSLKLRALLTHSDDDHRKAMLAKEATRTNIEFSELTDTVNEMLANLAERESAAAAAEAERIDVMRRFLPEDIARQVEVDERTIERVLNASAVSIVVTGVMESFGDAPTEALRDRLETIVAKLDQMGSEHGVRRVKVLGDMWVGVCGVDTPHVDHVARSVSLAADAIGLSADDSEVGGGLQISVGVSAGPVSAGLAGSERLVYDAWGKTINESNALAIAAHPGQIVVSAKVLEQLPPTASAQEHESKGPGPNAWIITPEVTGTGVTS